MAGKQTMCFAARTVMTKNMKIEFRGKTDRWSVQLARGYVKPKKLSNVRQMAASLDFTLSHLSEEIERADLDSTGHSLTSYAYPV